MLIIEQFLDRMARWPQLCAALIAERGVGPQFKNCYPDYYEYYPSGLPSPSSLQLRYLVKLLNAMPPGARDKPVFDYSMLQGVFLLPTPELYPPPLQEKEERELHAARVAAFKAGKPMPPPRREMVVYHGTVASSSSLLSLLLLLQKATVARLRQLVLLSSDRRRRSLL